MDLVANDGTSPLMVAVKFGRRDVSMFLVSVGADVQKCLQDSAPPGANHNREMITELYSKMGLPNSHSFDVNFGDAANNVKSCLFSLTHLMSSACPDLCRTRLSAESDGDHASHTLFHSDPHYCHHAHATPTVP